MLSVKVFTQVLRRSMIHAVTQI